MFKKLAVFTVIMTLFAATTTAQEMTVDETKQLTFLLAGTNTGIRAATDGTEWGVVYSRNEDSYNLYFLRATYNGDPIESRQLLKGKDGEQGLRNPRISAYPGGWAVTYINRPTNSEYTDSMYLLLLDESGRKVRQPTFIYHNSDSYIVNVEPVWTGSMFIVFYVAEAEMDGTGIWAAFIDDKGRKAMPDRLVTPLDETYYGLSAFTQVIPTSKGIAMVAFKRVGENDSRRVILRIAPDGHLMDEPKIVGGPNGVSLSFTSTLWDGERYALTYYDIVDGSITEPRIRLFSSNGNWATKRYVYTSNGVNRIYGAGFDGSNYVAVAYNNGNSTVYGQQLDGKMNPVGGPFIVDDSNTTSFTNRVNSVGSDAFYFATNRKVGFSPNAYNLYSTRIRFPHAGKPEINYYNGAVHEVDGKYYAFLDWHVAGVENVLIKTKGGKWTLPASGFHAAEIKKNKKSRFKLIAVNKTGKTKKKVKLVP